MQYLDNAATTQPDIFILDEIRRINKFYYGNPSSLYKIGQDAKEIINKAKMNIAVTLNCNPEDIIFTSCGSESNNLAIFGMLKNTDKKHIITTAIEHSSVLNSMKYLETQGYKVTYLPVNKDGVISLEDLEDSIYDETALISIMFVNNEIGSVQPIKEIAEIAKKYNIKFHCDGIQAMGNQKVDLQELGVDMFSISGHKMYAPKGIGSLYSKNLEVSNILYGGHQQNNKRPGTENTAYIHALGLAVKNYHYFDKELKEYAINKLKEIPGLTFNGKSDSHILNCRIPGINNEMLIIKLGLKDIFISGGSACNSSQPQPSHVLKALGLSDDECKECIRISFGKNNSKEDVDILVNEIKKFI